MTALTPFESIAKLTALKEPHTEAELRNFNAFIVNRGFSMSKELVYFADLANWNGMTAQQIHDFYFNLLPKKKVWSKWAKASKKDETLSLISRAYNISIREASMYFDLLSEEDVKKLEERVTYGGPTKRKKDGNDSE
jgi:hypothetical protein